MLLPRVNVSAPAHALGACGDQAWHWVWCDVMHVGAFLSKVQLIQGAMCVLSRTAAGVRVMRSSIASHVERTSRCLEKWVPWLGEANLASLLHMQACQPLALRAAPWSCQRSETATVDSSCASRIMREVVVDGTCAEPPGMAEGATLQSSKSLWPGADTAPVLCVGERGLALACCVGEGGADVPDVDCSTPACVALLHSSLLSDCHPGQWQGWRAPFAFHPHQSRSSISGLCLIPPCQPLPAANRNTPP